MQHLARLLLVFVATACTAGDPDPSDPPSDPPTGPTCGSAGSATVAGTVAGVSITPVARAAKLTFDPEGFVVLSLDETPGTVCGDAGPTGEHLVFGFCGEPGVGTHAIASSDAFACPGATGFAIIEQNEGEDLADATGGSITIERSDDSCTTGSFSVQFGGEQLTGTFDAVACPSAI